MGDVDSDADHLGTKYLFNTSLGTFLLLQYYQEMEEWRYRTFTLTSHTLNCGHIHDLLVGHQ